jgi:DNA-binding XRE family transcriptional regulator
MTCFSYRDGDLHDGRSHRTPTGAAGFDRRLALHMIAHEIQQTGGLVDHPHRAQHPDGMDPWLADITDRADSVLGARVRHLLREHGLSQQTFAATLGLTLGALSDRLSGRVPFSLAEAMFLCEEFGVTIDDLLGRP